MTQNVHTRIHTHTHSQRYWEVSCTKRFPYITWTQPMRLVRNGSGFGHLISGIFMFGKCGRRKLFSTYSCENWSALYWSYEYRVEAKWPHPPLILHNRVVDVFNFSALFMVQFQCNRFFFSVTCKNHNTIMRARAHARSHPHIWEINFHSKKRAFPILPSRFSLRSHHFQQSERKTEQNVNFVTDKDETYAISLKRGVTGK